MTDEVDVDASDLRHLSSTALDRGVRVCVAESLTSGRLASAVGAGEGAGSWFGGGVIAYQSAEKESVLGVTPGLDPCSAEVAEQMAEGARRLFDADLCVSTTGVGGPGPDDNGNPAGTVFLGWASAEGVGHRALMLSGDPAEVMDATVAHALRLLALHIDGIQAAGPRRTAR